MSQSHRPNLRPNGPGGGPAGGFEAPFYRAPEAVRTVFLVTLAAACGPLAAGAMLFGWRVLVVAGISVASCTVIERLYYRVTRTPALLGRSHAYLTGILLALTLPAFVPWYVPLIASAFAIIVGKAIFGGVGHFLWQPALVGRLAVAVMFPQLLNPPTWNMLARERLLVGDITIARNVGQFHQWEGRPAPQGADAFKVQPPSAVLAGLTDRQYPAFSALAYQPSPHDVPGPKPAALSKMPQIKELFYGARPGGIGETCIIVIVVAGMYLVYRHYVKWQLPVVFILSAAIVVAIAPVYFAGAQGPIKHWWPIAVEGFDVGFVYVCYQLLSGELLLAAFFLATEMTTRPVTAGGQVLFGIGCGLVAMVLRMFVGVPIPCYLAVLAMNTFTPTINALWRPRVLGKRSLLGRLLNRRGSYDRRPDRQ